MFSRGLIMKCSNGTNSGFTLVELIVVMVLVSIIAAVIGIGLVHVVQSMVFTKMNAVTIQKGQITITKLIKEFNNISDVTAASAISITFASYKDGVSGSHTFARSGNNITFDGDIITDQVSDFSLNYYDNFNTPPQSTWQASRKIIEIKLKLTGAGNLVSQFQERVRPRNLP